jgi:hypothetical protein
MRIGPSHPWLGAVGFNLTLPLLEFIYRQQAIYRSGSRFARARVRAIKDKIERGQTDDEEDGFGSSTVPISSADTESAVTESDESDNIVVEGEEFEE